MAANVATMSDVIVFGPKADDLSIEEKLTAGFNAAAEAVQPYIDAYVQMAAAVAASLQPMVDFINQMARALQPVMEVRAEQVSAGHREYRRRSMARRRRHR